MGEPISVAGVVVVRTTIVVDITEVRAVAAIRSVEYNQYIIHPFLLIFYFVFRSLFLIFSYQPLPN